MDALDMISDQYERCGKALRPVNQCECGKMMVSSAITWNKEYTLYKWVCTDCGNRKETKDYK